MKSKGHIKIWEWARMKRWFLAGESYTTIAKRSRRSRSVIAAHGKKYRWQEQREAIRAIRQTASISQSLKYLEFSEDLLLEYIEKLNVSRTLKRVQQAKANLSE